MKHFYSSNFFKITKLNNREHLFTIVTLETMFYAKNNEKKCLFTSLFYFFLVISANWCKCLDNEPYHSYFIHLSFSCDYPIHFPTLQLRLLLYHTQIRVWRHLQYFSNFNSLIFCSVKIY